MRDAGRGPLHRYYRIEGATHTDSLYDVFPDRPRPLVPCHRSGFTALERRLSTGARQPASKTVALPAGADPTTLVNRCPPGRQRPPVGAATTRTPHFVVASSMGGSRRSPYCFRP